MPHSAYGTQNIVARLNLYPVLFIGLEVGFEFD